MKRSSTLLLATFVCLLISISSTAQISGTVFRDFNGNGNKDNTASYNEPFVSGITVKAFDSLGAQLGTTKTTNASGAYSFTALEIPAGKSARIEFSGVAATDFSSLSGSQNASNIQFAKAPSATVSYAVNAPDDYWNNAAAHDSSLMITQIYRGTNTNPNSAARFSLLHIADNASGPNAPANSTVITIDTSKRPANFNQTGSINGLAYQQTQERFFTAAYLKRMAGLGPQGVGGVYIATKSGATWTYGGSFTLQGVTPSNGGGALDFGAVTRVTTPTSDDNYLPPTTGSWTLPTGSDGRDNDAFVKAGTMTYGDIDFPKNSDTLYMINLFQKRLIVFDASAATATLNGATAATLAPFTKAYTITSLPGCPAATGTGNNIRPFGLKFYKGKGYLGVVSDAMGTQAVADLKGYILQFDPKNIAAGFTTVLTINFNLYSGNVHPWITTWAQSGGTATAGTTEWMQPMISNMEFNEDGSMDISIRDRWGDQGAAFEFFPIAGAGAFHTQTAEQGDLLHACWNGTNWILEGTAGSCTQPLTNGDPGLSPYNPISFGNSYNNTGKEYYGDVSGDNRNESFQGSSAKLMGSGKIVSTVYDPILSGVQPTSNYWSTQGLVWNNNSTGLKVQIARTGSTGQTNMDKANALGDIEYITTPEPIQVGNRVWNDANGNGIQDAGEAGIGGVTVQLMGPGVDGTLGTADDVLLASTTTAATGDIGSYYFTTLTTQDTRKPALWTGIIDILPGVNYQIRINNGQAALTGINAVMTTSDAGGNDLIDGDGLLETISAANYSYVNFNTNTVNHNFDFGFRQLGSISDRVWLDDGGGTPANANNGTQDAGEVGVSGVTVTLYDNAGAVIATTKTDANGLYIFNNLPVSAAGVNYQVQFSLPTQYKFTSQAGLPTVATNSDANITTGRTSNITLTAATPNVTYVDAGIVPTTPNKLGDYIWYDSNGDGLQTAGEPGISGVTVTLFNSAGNAIRTTVTDNNGYYQFTDIPAGTYTAGITPPAGYVLTGKGAGSSATGMGGAATNSDFNTGTYKTDNLLVTATTNDMTIDGGLVKQTSTLCSLGDRVWYDMNNNGLQDAGETGVAGVTIQLYNTSNVLQATLVTDEFGNYIFNGLATGTYYVKFTNTPVGWGTSTANTGSNDFIDSDVSGVNGTGTTGNYTLVSGQTNTTVDLGITPPGGTFSIGDKVFYDLNKNGIQNNIINADSTEAGVPGVTVILYNSAGLPADSTVTDANGNYLFTGLAANTYSIGFTNIPKGYSFATQNADAAGLAGANNSDADPTSGRTSSILVNAGNPNPRYFDAGIVSGNTSTQNAKASLGDRVWNDINNNGIQDAGEPGIPGVTVTLYAADGTTVIATTTTDALGYYLFSNLNAGNYIIGFGTPSGYTFSAQNQGTNKALDSDPNTGTGKTAGIILQAGEANMTIDAGFHSSTAGLSSLGDKVWIDANGNGIQDAGEPGVPGVTATLYDINGNFVKTTVTDNNGFYLFADLPAAGYEVGFSNLPAGFTITGKNAGGSTAANGSDVNIFNNRTDMITLPASTNDLTWDMGIVPQATRAALGDYVWFDNNNNGLQDGTEAGVPGILVTLYDATGTTPIATAVTDARGFYFFPNLTPASYVVGFSNLPAGSGFTTQNADAAGQNGPVNSDVNVTTGKTASITLSAGQVNTNIDAGIITNFAAVGNFVWYDLNSNGLQDGTEPGVPGILVTLYDATTNQPVAAAVTDGNGHYFINNVPAAAAGTSYYVIFGAVPSNPFTNQNVDASGINGAINSDVNTVTGKTSNFSLFPGQVNLNIDAGVRNFPLPVQGLELTATLRGTVATVNWTTENEINTSRFFVERSTDNRNFASVGDLAAAGNYSGILKYALNDNVSGLNGVIYYRIKVLDIDGKTSYSAVVAVRISSIREVKVWPNPFTEKVNISLYSETSGTVQVKLADYAGKTVQSANYAVSRGNNQLDIANLEGLTNGVYILRLNNASGETLLVQKLVKQ